MSYLTSSRNNLIERLKASPFYQICQDAFRKSTGLPLVILNAKNTPFNPCHTSLNQNPFCRVLNAKHGSCEECIKEQQLILKHSHDQTYTHTCFAGLRETSVPLKLGKETIGYLKTGQVFTQKPSAEYTKQLRKVLHDHGYSKAEQSETINSYRKTPVFDNERYQSMITLLNIISLQLGELVNRIILESAPAEPEAIRKAKEFINDRIDEKITLAEVSKEINVSTFYFCKLFKQSTGMTFTEFINRQRIELAKKELSTTQRSITEIAYSVGFQSLSQFNRSFCKYTGQAPREYRERSKSSAEERLFISG